MPVDILRQIKALQPKPELKLRIIEILRRKGQQGVSDLKNELGYESKSSLYRYLDELDRGGVIQKIPANGKKKWEYKLEDFHINLTPESVAQYYSEAPDDVSIHPQLEEIKKILYDSDIEVVDASGQKIPFSPSILMKDFLDAGVGINEALSVTKEMKETAYNGITAKEMRKKVYKSLKNKGWTIAANRYRRYIIDPIQVENQDELEEWEENDLMQELKKIREENSILVLGNREMNRIAVNAMKNLKKLRVQPIPKKFIREYLTLLLRNIRI